MFPIVVDPPGAAATISIVLKGTGVAQPFERSLLVKMDIEARRRDRLKAKAGIVAAGGRRQGRDGHRQAGEQRDSQRTFTGAPKTWLQRLLVTDL